MIIGRKQNERDNMDIQKILTDACSARRAEVLKTSPQLTLGEIILKLEAIKDKEKDILFDFCQLRPISLRSWRGDYSELAFGFDEEHPYPKVKDVLQWCKDAVGKTFQGYKGGDFTMGKSTPVWVANYGNSGDTGVLDIFDDAYSVYIITGRCDY